MDTLSIDDIIEVIADYNGSIDISQIRSFTISLESATANELNCYLEDNFERED